MRRADSPTAAVANGPTSGDLGRQVHDALARLHDVGYLQTHPFAERLRLAAGESAGRAGRAVRQTLLEAIEALRPGAPATAEARRRHEILRLRYAEGHDARAV